MRATTMAMSNQKSTPKMTIAYRKVTPSSATDADKAFIMSVFDSCIVWLNTEKGISEQWGTEPWSVTKGVAPAERVLRVGEAKREGAGTYVITISKPNEENEEQEDEVPVGVIALGERHDYIRALENSPSDPWPELIKESPAEELYLAYLAVHRTYKGLAIGDAALEFAKHEAKRAGKSVLRTDTFAATRWGEGKDGLVRWYEKRGMKRLREYVIKDEKAGREVDGVLMEVDV